jgi:uncharacterized protein YggU (UPF0235/DUF167 family)
MKTRLTLKVRAGARKTEFSGKLGDVWKLQVAAPPVDGKANDAVVRFLAKLLSVSPSSVRILTGVTSPTKIVEIEGVDAGQLERAILETHEYRSHPGSSAPGET